ncbi:bifunctional adenosylcobinamide kinase/adenosylcobinamide-phosphate guanylyltransferase [Thalassotalea profundi]|uniref:Bifunctional adenosylcobalamin biosynthesis protein n=1 Tax=Thalassotalea profundi TaxID=2036687 RepID=A0ABQ3IQS2_9GAMM|nr:bifunctional adenosylcobinamide kinase/adenosylcobinamide-phosphate guanylyltransferase [Thalassotalea profundi]GHE91631.1 adenosylcobinamide kinase/adenosylcobinamide phosphate guanyltransferase [Thalassotalea profundi]
MIHLIIGGARSGKSSFAEQCVIAKAEVSNDDIAYIATATAFDDEMKQRIALHQEQRADNPWELIECPYELTECISQLTGNKVYLIECLTLWLSNLLLKASNLYREDTIAIDRYLHQQVQALVSGLVKSEAELVIVSNEVGQGIVPLGELNRLFVDHMGWLNQGVAKVADRVDFICAGIAQSLKSPESLVLKKSQR